MTPATGAPAEDEAEPGRAPMRASRGTSRTHARANPRRADDPTCQERAAAVEQSIDERDPGD